MHQERDRGRCRRRRPWPPLVAERVIDDDGDVHLFRLVFRHPFFERHLVGCDDGEALGGDAIALRAVAVTPKGDARLSVAVGGEDDRPADVPCQVLLKDSPIDNFYGVKTAHLVPPFIVLVALQSA